MRRLESVVPFVLVALAACQSQPSRQVSSGLQLAPTFRAAPPSQIAILPVEDRTGDRSFLEWADRLRVAVERQLAGRAYSPLSPGYVDERLTAIGRFASGSPTDPAWLAELRGSFQEEALLGLQMVEWDARRIVETRRVTFSIEVRMLDSSSGATLWSGRFGGSVKSGGDGATPLTRDRQLEAAVDEVAAALVAELPIRAGG
jgi:hypothetical protein